jgi:hypothetical protein
MFVVHDRLILAALERNKVRFILDRQWVQILDTLIDDRSSEVTLSDGTVLFIIGSGIYLKDREEVNDEHLMELEFIKDQETVMAIREAGYVCEKDRTSGGFYVNFLVANNDGRGSKDLGKGIIIDRNNVILSVRR